MGGAGGGVVTPSIQQYCLKWNNHQVGSHDPFSRSSSSGTTIRLVPMIHSVEVPQVEQPSG